MYNFNEAELEQAVLEWFQELYYNVAYGPEISPGGDYPERDDYDEVILKERLMDALRRVNPRMPEDALEKPIVRLLLPRVPVLSSIIRNFTDLLPRALR